eukprot:Pompholyxophrys_punicea_v1_NODE_241_length_2580_cov_2.879208.p1 type:complete len:155 gc:universal NODE_241_length_2580_cov_2.879208:1731-1267(-)
MFIPSDLNECTMLLFESFGLTYLIMSHNNLIMSKFSDAPPPNQHQTRTSPQFSWFQLSTRSKICGSGHFRSENRDPQNRKGKSYLATMFAECMRQGHLLSSLKFHKHFGRPYIPPLSSNHAMSSWNYLLTVKSFFFNSYKACCSDLTRYVEGFC